MPTSNIECKTSASPPRNSIVIVGGGYAGLNILNALSASLGSSTTNITVITPRTYFHYLPASIRMCVTAVDALEDASLLPFQPHHCTGNKRIINAKVTAIVDFNTEKDSDGNSGVSNGYNNGHVVLDTGDRVEYTVLILTPGTRWDGLWDFPDTKEEVVSMMKSSRERFRYAKNIVIVGGGSSGAELAGEIKDLDGVRRAFLSLSLIFPGTVYSS